jgi:hypothetical protein
MCFFQPMQQPAWSQKRRAAACRAAMIVAGTLLAWIASARAAEPDDTLLTATALGTMQAGVPVVVDGLLGDGDQGQRDVDFYSLTIDETVPLPITLSVQIEPGTPEVDPFARLFDAAGVELVNNDDTAADTRACGVSV